MKVRCEDCRSLEVTCRYNGRPLCDDCRGRQEEADEIRAYRAAQGELELEGV